MACKAALTNEDLISIFQSYHFWNITESVGWGHANYYDDVLLIQFFLNSTINANLKTDGQFGPKTSGAIKKFQLKMKRYTTQTDGKVNAVNGSDWRTATSGSVYTMYLLNVRYKDYNSHLYFDIRADPTIPTELCALLSLDI